MLARKEHIGGPVRLGSERGNGERPEIHRGSKPTRFHPTLILGYSVAAIMMLVGLAILLGYFMHEGVPEKFRIMFGLVMALMGGYRFVLTRTRAIRLKKEDDEEES